MWIKLLWLFVSIERISSDLLHLTPALRTLEPPPYAFDLSPPPVQYGPPNHSQYPLLDLPEIIDNRAAVAIQSHSNGYNYQKPNQEYLPPSTTRPPPHIVTEVNYYLPPSKPPNDVYLPPPTTTETPLYHPPIVVQDPVPTYLPPTIGDHNHFNFTFPPQNYPTSTDYPYPPSAGGYVYRIPDKSFDLPQNDNVAIHGGRVSRNRSGIGQIRLSINEMRCLGNRGGYFKANLSIHSFISSIPTIESDSPINEQQCGITVSGNTVLISLYLNDFHRCGIYQCGTQQLCIRLRFPQIRGMRTIDDGILTLQCQVQDRVTMKHHAIRMNISNQNNARSSSGVLAQGGQKQPFHTKIGLFRHTNSNDGNLRTVADGEMVELGENLMLRAQVRTGDGWNYTRLSDVNLLRLSPNGDVINSAMLLTSNGCLNPKMKNICEQLPVYEPPLGTRFQFKAVMFQGMKSGDEIIMNIRLTGCVDQKDCILDEGNCERSGIRRRRNLPLSVNDKYTELTQISFRVRLPDSQTLNDGVQTADGANNWIRNSIGHNIFASFISILCLLVLIGIFIYLRRCMVNRKCDTYSIE